MDFRLWNYVEIFLDTDFMPFWWAWDMLFSLRGFFFFLLVLLLATIPLCVWVCPASVVIIKHCWTILWMDWRCLLAILACMT